MKNTCIGFKLHFTLNDIELHFNSKVKHLIYFLYLAEPMANHQNYISLFEMIVLMFLIVLAQHH